MRQHKFSGINRVCPLLTVMNDHETQGGCFFVEGVFDLTGLSVEAWLADRRTEGSVVS